MLVRAWSCVAFLLRSCCIWAKSENTAIQYLGNLEESLPTVVFFSGLWQREKPACNGSFKWLLGGPAHQLVWVIVGGETSPTAFCLSGGWWWGPAHRGWRLSGPGSVRSRVEQAVRRQAEQTSRASASPQCLSWPLSTTWECKSSNPFPPQLAFGSDFTHSNRNPKSVDGSRCRQHGKGAKGQYVSVGCARSAHRGQEEVRALDPQGLEAETKPPCG